MAYIRFKCPGCGKTYLKTDDTVGERFVCKCGDRLKVPKKNDGHAGAKRLTDRLIESSVYGVGGALLGLGLGFLIASRPFVRGRKYIIAGCTVLGFVVCLLGGERAVVWIGQKIREREES